MDPRAKQRLTGAIILVALFVLLVPELLTGPEDSRPAASADESAESEGLREYTIDIDDQNRAAQTAVPAAQQPAVSLPAVEAPPAADSGRAVPGEAASTAVPAPAPAPAASATNPMAAPPVSAPPIASAPVPAPTRPEPAATPNQKPERGTFVVQLGSFGSRDNADRLVRDMKAKGFSAFVAPITSNGRELFRVRVGPTRDRAAAESLAAELKRAGQSGSIVPIS